MNKNIALFEFGLNLTEQKILTKKQFLKYSNNFNWRFFEFELGYWRILNEKVNR
jgi:hypothetical protein